MQEWLRGNNLLFKSAKLEKSRKRSRNSEVKVIALINTEKYQISLWSSAQQKQHSYWGDFPVNESCGVKEGSKADNKPCYKRPSRQIWVFSVRAAKFFFWATTADLREGGLWFHFSRIIALLGPPKNKEKLGKKKDFKFFMVSVIFFWFSLMFLALGPRSSWESPWCDPLILCAPP